ncbi:MAG: hypothetical protein IAE83_01535 [Anaerolinea sp.]|nr:hypothetical protein [Anaerolinea sp.]
MPTIEVLFEIPVAVVNGLATGSLERVGGVIREAGSKEVVMWLREGGQISQNPGVAQGLMASVLRSSGMSSATVGVVLAGTLSTLNVALSGYTLYLMIARVHALEAQIEHIHERVAEEFARDRQVDFETALASAGDVVDAENETFKQQAASRAIDQLFNTRQHLLRDFDAVLEDKMTPQQCQQAQLFLLQAMHVDTLRIRCYLETDQLALAKSRLAASLEAYQNRTQALIQKWLGDYPALYFHETISDEDFERYINIERWLRDKDDVLMDVVKTHRHDFWNKDAIRPLHGSVLSAINVPFMKRDVKETTPPYLLALAQSEILIENYQRLLGFELELASMRLEFPAWDRLADITEHDDFVMLADSDWLQKLDRLSL